MNFFTALSIFHIITPGVDVSPLPLRSTTYIVDSTGVLPSDQEIWQVKSSGLLENILLKPNPARTKVDTSRSYMRLNSANNPIQLTSQPVETPIQNGAEFIYSDSLLNTRFQYENGKKVYTTDYQYAGGYLERRITVDSVGPVDTTIFTYQEGKITVIESHLRAGFLKTKYIYRGVDTIESREYDFNESPSATRVLWILKDGNIQKQNTYTYGKLTAQTIYEHLVVTGIKNLSDNPVPLPISNKEGRLAPVPLFWWLGAESHDALGRNFRKR